MLDSDYRVGDKGFKNYQQNYISLRMMSPTLNLQLWLAGSQGNSEENLNLWYYKPICLRRWGQLSQLSPLNRLLPRRCFQTASTSKQLDGGLSTAVQRRNNGAFNGSAALLRKDLHHTIGGKTPLIYFLLWFGFNLRNNAAVFLKLQITSEQHLLNYKGLTYYHSYHGINNSLNAISCRALKISVFFLIFFFF